MLISDKSGVERLKISSGGEVHTLVIDWDAVSRVINKMVLMPNFSQNYHLSMACGG